MLWVFSMWSNLTSCVVLHVLRFSLRIKFAYKRYLLSIIYNIFNRRRKKIEKFGRLDFFDTDTSYHCPIKTNFWQPKLIRHFSFCVSLGLNPHIPYSDFRDASNNFPNLNNEKVNKKSIFYVYSCANYIY